MWYNHKFYRYSVAVILVFLMIFMLGKIQFFLLPLKSMLTTILAPILVGGIFFYILRPLVGLLQRFKLPRSVAILITFVLLLIIVVAASTYTGSLIANQFVALTNDIPKSIDMAREKTSGLMGNEWFSYIYNNELQQKLTSNLERFTQSLSSLIFNFIGTLTSIGAVLLLVPFVLFYLLKDGDNFSAGIVKLTPKKHRSNVKKILYDVDNVLSSYIMGQMAVAFSLGVMMFIGYKIIGLNYPVVLAIFAMVTCIIPFFGSWIGIVPAVLVGLTMNPLMTLKVLIVMIVVQQIDSNFISPQVMRRSLDIHPLTVMLLLTGSVTILGFMGLLIAIPLYAVIKVTVKNIYSMYFSEDAA